MLKLSNKKFVIELMISIILGTLGAILAWYLNMPAPFLLGPTIVCSISAIMGLKFSIPDFLRNLGFTIIGITIGSNITPNSLSQISTWPISLLMMLSTIILITFFGKFFLSTFYTIDKKSSILASSPGHLSFVLSISNDIKTDTPKIAIIQSIRVLSLTLLTPLLVITTTDIEISNNFIINEKTIPLTQLLLILVASLIFGLAIMKTKIPAPFLMGGIICTTFSHGSGITEGLILPIFSIFAFIILGIIIGARFVSVDIKLLKSSFLGGFILTLSGAVVSFLFAFLTSKITKIELVDAIIAFAPGGLETMLAMGSIVDADPTYVALHHVIRILFLTFLVPFLIFRNNSTTKV